eukprot:647409-Alexandrium_andersonii.AAC.1
MRNRPATALLKFIWSPLEKEHVQKLLREGHAEGVLEALSPLLPLVKTSSKFSALYRLVFQMVSWSSAIIPPEV